MFRITKEGCEGWGVPSKMVCGHLIYEIFINEAHSFSGSYSNAQIDVIASVFAFRIIAMQ
jgi:hypothetical protein